MIMLTTPLNIPSELGGSTTNSYNKLRVVSIVADPYSMTITAQVQLLMTTNAAAPIISGSLYILATGGSPICTLQIPSLNFFTGISLSGGQVTAIQDWITGLQNNIENGLVSNAMVAGTQSTGT